MVALLAVIRSVAPLVDPSRVHWLYALGAFFVADQIRGLFAVMPRFERQLFLLEMFVGACATGWVYCRNRAALRRGDQGKTGMLGRLTVAVGLLLVGFTVAFLAGAAGFMSLARQMGHGTLGSAYVALALSAGIRVVYGLVVLLLRVRPLGRLTSVQRHRALLEERASGFMRWIAVAIWAWATLALFSVLAPVAAFTKGVLTAEFGWGSLALSLGDIISFGVTVWAAFLVSRFVNFALEEDVYPRVRLAPGIPYAISSLLHYVILFVGFLLAVSALGLDLTKVTIIGGAFGVGIGFGLQNVVNNFVSGLIILFERPVRVGDAVQIADVSGQVRRIGIRSSTVRTWEGAEVIVPNAMLVSDRVTNWTPTDRWRRISLPVGVSYGSDPEKILEILRGVAREHTQVLSNPAPQPLFMAFGESALLFELRVWTDGLADWMQVRSELAVALNAALREAGHEIALPVRQVLIRHGSGGGVASDGTVI
jgi:small-conductance mechanosensitive channel